MAMTLLLGWASWMAIVILYAVRRNLAGTAGMDLFCFGSTVIMGLLIVGLRWMPAEVPEEKRGRILVLMVIGAVLASGFWAMSSLPLAVAVSILARKWVKSSLWAHYLAHLVPVFMILGSSLWIMYALLWPRREPVEKPYGDQPRDPQLDHERRKAAEELRRAGACPSADDPPNLRYEAERIRRGR